MMMTIIITIIIIIIGKIYKNAIHNLGCGVALFGTFLRNELVMYVSTDQQLVRFKNSVCGFLSRLWQGRV